MNKTLVIFTHGAPYANGENAFLMPELPLLAERFQRVLLVPDCHKSDTEPPRLPQNVDVCTFRHQHKRNRFLALLCGLLSFKWLSECSCIFSRTKFLALLEYIAEVEDFKGYFRSLVRRLDLDIPNTLFYTFWMTHESSGLAELTEENPRMSFVTRAHGYDLYDYRVLYRSRRYRRMTLRTAKGVFCCSKDGARYLNKHYPGHAGKVQVAYLGFNASYGEPCAFAQNANVLRLVTVANLVPVKQHVKFICALQTYARRHPKIKIVYDIIGEGPERDNIVKAIEPKIKNLAIELLGQQPHDKVLSRYTTTMYDLFVLPSQSEGLSVAVMEAMAYGIPALVTKVGGMPELVVGGDTGFLISKEFLEDEVCLSLEMYVKSDKQLLRSRARQIVAECFNESSCRREFVEAICI